MSTDSNIIKFPRKMFGQALMRTVDHSLRTRKQRRSKKTTPEERAAKSAVVDLSEVRSAAEKTDGRKLRRNPLRAQYNSISPAVTITGKMYTAELKKEPLPPAETESWLQELQAGAAAARLVAEGLNKAAERLMRGEAEELYLRLPPHLRQIADQKTQAMINEERDA